jgi:hypothetical protein
MVFLSRIICFNVTLYCIILLFCEDVTFCFRFCHVNIVVTCIILCQLNMKYKLTNITQQTVQYINVKMLLSFGEFSNEFL